MIGSKKQFEYIVISYASGMPGFSPSEWLDDKLQVLSQRGLSVLLITSTASGLVSTNSLRVRKISSISRLDFLSELKQGQLSGIRKLFGHAISLTIGNIFDFCFSWIAGSTSQGRWSWFFSCFPVVFRSLLENPGSRVLVTGGPSSAHLAASVAARICSRNVVFEFQDPFIGSEMQLPDRTLRVLERIEGFIIKSSVRTIFVTELAASAAKKRHPSLSLKIRSVYPGAWNYLLASTKGLQHKANGSTIEFLHLGTLYGNRNLSTFFQALDLLRNESPKTLRSLSCVNLGSLYGDIANQHRDREDFIQLDQLPRILALKRATQASFLLLVQHSDSRSRETIPFKFYDYLNVKRPIFLLHNNEELAQIVLYSGGYAAKVDDVAEIQIELRRALVDYKTGQFRLNQSPLSIDAEKSFDELFRS